jgi:inorganic triphosphatase YgiF
MSSGREIELKFLCDPSDSAALLEAAPPGDEAVRDLVSIYFDTPHGALRKAGASLRIRQAGERRVQTLKRGTGFARDEIETELDAASDGPEAGLLSELPADCEISELAPVFEVRVQRRLRRIHMGEALVELALDQGEIVAGEAVKAISELELELISGPPSALFDLARTLARAAPIYRAFEGKAAQGHALADGVAGAPLRSDKPTLDPQATAAEGFQAISRSAVAQIAANAALAREGPSPGAVHQIRVGARRLKSAISVFGPLLGEDGAAAIRAELGWLGEVCAEARALDVLIAETVEPALAAGRWREGRAGLDDLLRALKAAQARAHAKAAAAMASARFRTLLIEAEAWIETGAWLADDEAGGSEPVAEFAARALRKRRRKLLKAGADLAALDDAGRHRARIQAKKLRYAAEAFASLFDEAAAGRFVKGLKKLQDELGALNDEAGLEALLAEQALDGPALFAAGRLVGEAAGRKRDRVARAAKAMDALAGMTPFWRG